MDTYGIIGFSIDNVGIDRRFYTGRTDTDPILAVSYNERRVDVYLNGIKLIGDHPGNSNHDYDIDAQTGQGSSITLKTGIALVASDVIECIGQVSLAGNTVTTYNPTPASGGGWNVFASIDHVASDLVNVYMNGVLLDDSDYTLDASANTLTIGGATLTASDVIMVQVIGALDNANFVPVGGGTFIGNVSFGDNNITNVGDISLDTISSDAGTSIGVTLGTDAGDDFNVGTGKLNVEGDNGNVTVGSGNIVIGTSGKGIDFTATSGSGGGSSSAILDDYEEGTFTQTVTSSTSGSTTLNSDYNTGSYTKIGRMVTATCRMLISSSSSPTGDIRFSLPFACNSQSENESECYGSLYWYQINDSAKEQFVFQVVPGASYGRIQKMDNANGASATYTGALENQWYGYTVTYFTA
jgi:hypothetical protein